VENEKLWKKLEEVLLMSLIDKIVKKFMNEEYEDYSLADSMDGCAGESTISKIKEFFKKVIPC
jgi:hypothetical protein